MERLYGLVGRSLEHSFSEAYFARKFAAEGIEGCAYRNFEIPAITHLADVLAANPALAGFNVTIPYKEEILPLLASVEALAQRVGAVNCVRVRGGELHGYNTDVAGIRASLAALLAKGEKPETLVLGTGGASRAVRYALEERGIAFRSVSRDATRGDLTYDQIDSRVISSVSLIVNATPVGTFPRVHEAPLLPYDALTSAHALFDLVYNPAPSRFLRLGAARGARTLDGLLMLRVQAEASWAIWTR